MFKKIVFLVGVLLFVSCGSKQSTSYRGKTPSSKKHTVPTGKKVVEKELVSKEEYRAQLHKKEAERKKEEKKKSSSEVLEATSRLSVTTDMIRDYILEYKDIAKDNMTNHGIPASITLAQGVLESGSGQGTLSRNANNHFGIKCHQGWEGASVRHTDDAPDECFRKYDSPHESYRDHSLFLVNRSRYSDLFLLEQDDYKGWAKGLKSAGYATDPRYADKLISLIERYSLYEYDAEVLKKKPSKIVSSKAESPKEVKSTSKKNSNSVHIVKKGDTLYSISRRYNLTVEQLQKKNKLTGTNLAIGQTLKIK